MIVESPAVVVWVRRFVFRVVGVPSWGRLVAVHPVARVVWRSEQVSSVPGQLLILLMVEVGTTNGVEWLDAAAATKGCCEVLWVRVYSNTVGWRADEVGGVQRVEDFEQQAAVVPCPDGIWKVGAGGRLNEKFLATQ